MTLTEVIFTACVSTTESIKIGDPLIIKKRCPGFHILEKAPSDRFQGSKCPMWICLEEYIPKTELTQ